MPYKDPEKKREYDKKRWRDNVRGIPFGQRDQHRRKLSPTPNEFHDYDTHKQLAMNSGINSAVEWHECHKMRLFPDGIYSNPNKAFRRK